MEVILAGYNLDVETLREAKEYLKKSIKSLPKGSPLKKEIKEFLKQDNFTPETLSAAYARISRNPAPVPELREISRREVDRSRRSNQTIIFGLGHSSVAEHAVFNFDVLGVSRRIVEEIQHFRLTSFTEKSQRYILLEDDYVIPQELRGTELEYEFQLMINTQNQAYHDLNTSLKPYIFDRFDELTRDTRNHSMLEGWAKEDSRYIVSLATEAQMGMTVNARSFEHMISKLSSHPLPEAREFASRAFDSVEGLAPSLIKYTDPTPYTVDMPMKMAQKIDQLAKEIKYTEGKSIPEVRLVKATPKGDTLIIEAVLIEFSGMSMKKAKTVAGKLTAKDKKVLLKTLFRHMEGHNNPPRAFERVNAEFELVVSSSCYGQLKRHRMCSQAPGPYDITLGNTIPETIKAVGMGDYFMEVVNDTNELYNKILEFEPKAADYILTNSHRRRLHFKANLRELYHFSRLREDAHAQWDIRNIGHQMMEKIRKEWPLATVMLAGKDSFGKELKRFLRS